jgi:DNA-binding transcriptional ArsR family regulator
MTLSFDPDDPYFQAAVVKALWFVDPFCQGAFRSWIGRAINNDVPLLKLNTLSRTLKVLEEKGLVCRCHQTSRRWMTTARALNPMRAENVPLGTVITLRDPVKYSVFKSYDILRVLNREYTYSDPAGQLFLVVEPKNRFEICVIGESPGIYRLSVEDLMRFFKKV